MTTPAGVCRFCGCTEHDACVVDELLDVRGCSWIDRGRRVCSVCAPAAKAEGGSLRVLRRAGYTITAAWLRAHHLGFVVGWFGVTPRSPYGRNPFPSRPSTPHGAWNLGWNAGVDARRVYVTTFGAITNDLRLEALQAIFPRGRRVRA